VTQSVFIDGAVGTTGLEIADRLSSRSEFAQIILPEDKRKDTAARREALNDADFVILCLPDDAAREAATLADKCGYQVLGANRELAGAEVELVGLERREKRLKQALDAVQGDYDFVLIDCPPSLSLLTLNGLCSAHGVIVPMQCEYFALEGLTDLVNTIKQVHANLNRDLQIIGLLRVMFDPRITLQQQVSEQLKAHFKDKVFNTVIPRNVRLAEAPSYGQAGVVFDPSSRGAQAYIAFAQEMVERIGTMR